METLQNTSEYKIPLTKNKYAFVDKQDYEELSKYKWYCLNGRYACRGIWNPETKKTTQILMHRQILGYPNLDIDHIDRDGLNNTRENIRVISHSKNLHNRPKQKNNTSGYKGVSYCKEENRIKKWEAKIKVGGISRYLGRFFTAEEAHKAYNFAAGELVCTK